ncbi:MAG TPA: glycoside hydrolase family 57 protein [Gemmataceae bacterium]|nr:glycoside hydrolase family 57 protein [Gemmataceae bacterium]
MADIVLTFLWHQHQPYYPDDVSGENPMPWVRLHGVKDYYGMALHLLEFPEMRCTINLVPSLLLQLLAYTEHNASDRFLDVSRIPADDLQEADSLFLLDHFFMANPDQMIRPFPRYAELYQRRAAGRNSARDVLRRFQTRDLRDLQVWFNLAWVHPLAIERDDCLRGLRDKGRNFTEEDRENLLAKHQEILKQIIPLHKKLADSGQVELTTTPYFHPILPLLFDKKLAREAMPEVKLPRYTGGYPDDAAVHVRRAIEQHERIFGQRPHGMWPAEGSVCQSMLPLLAEHGIRWIATDEEVLSASTHGQVSRDGKGHVRNPERMYQAYKVREVNAELGIVFRDHALSDLIGFHYQRSDPKAAADNFMSCLYGISQVVTTKEPALVSIILDGENCWEHYPGGGVDFLRALYERCTRTPGVKPMKIGEYLERYPPRETLPRLFAGSWISHNFAIWIGHEEDNAAWDALHQTREYLRVRSQESGVRSQESGVRGQRTDSCLLTPDSCLLSPLERAWEELYIAEGSDWFWWFGDDHSSAQDALFDYLFRKHLQNVYILLGDTPPPELARPISRKGQRVHYTTPRALLDVKIDGRYTFFEWVSAGHYICQNERGTMAMATQGPLEELYFGFDLSLLLIRIDFNRPARGVLADFEVWRGGFIEPAGFEVRVSNPGRPDQRAELLRDGVPLPDIKLAVGIDQIAEIAIPFDALGIGVDQHLQFYVELLRDGQGQDRAPREGAIVLTRPSRDFEQIMWDV